MIALARLRNPIQSYAWGSRTCIADFLGRPSPAAEPQAELWMGAHPQGPSEVELDGRWISLADVIADDPEQVLGSRVVTRHGPELPFLFKVLAAGQALSIQAHPDRQQAAAGCRREDALQIPRSAPERNYRDSNHKPEVLYALTPFAILRGFRPPGQILERMRALEIPELLPQACGALERGDLQGFFSAYMATPEEELSKVLARARRRLEAGDPDDEGNWVVQLERRFPEDPGALAPLFLHVLELAPGEALFTGPGVLHAYLDGLGIELMANSDNVVRGGLTPKHVDVEELLRIVRFEPEAPVPLDSSNSGGERRFATVAEEFELCVLRTTPDQAYQGGNSSVEILLCSEGQGIARAGGVELPFRQGDSMLVPAAVDAYQLEGEATLFRAGVPG